MSLNHKINADLSCVDSEFTLGKVSSPPLILSLKEIVRATHNILTAITTTTITSTLRLSEGSQGSFITTGTDNDFLPVVQLCGYQEGNFIITYNMCSYPEY